MRLYDVAVVGGGPAGLAAAICAARVGLGVVVLERAPMPVDKACGEGLMPSGVSALERLGALSLLDGSACAPFRSIRYVQEDGSRAEARLPPPGGLGIRRVALVSALSARAEAVGAEIQDHTQVLGIRRGGAHVEVATRRGVVRTRLGARLVVAADGLSSPLRRDQGLELSPRGPQRFGVRRHLCLRPWSDAVEVHFVEGAEAYVTPTGPERIGVAFLWDRASQGAARFDALLARFPALARSLAGAPTESEARGAGPMLRRVNAQVLDRFALLGDAAGYVDAITGEGLSLAFRSAETLGALLPSALNAGATRKSLLPYQRAFRSLFLRYALSTRALLAVARRPPERKRAIHLLARHPVLFEQLVAAVAR